MRSRAAVLLAFFACAAVPAVRPAAAQFGQNKITYERFDWKVYRSPHFDVHHYGIDEPTLAELVSEAESAYLDLSRRLDHEVKNRIPLILFRTHTEFQQTNISMAEIPEFVGGFSEPFQNRMVIPIDDPPDKRYELIRHELTHIFQFDIFYAGSVRRALRSQAPLWLLEGMASYLADDEDSIDQMIIRDAVVNNLVPPVRALSSLGYLTYRYGHALMDFIETTYGPQGFRNFLFEFRKILLSANPGKAFEDAFGLTEDAFDRRFARFLRQRYLPVLTEKRAPEDYGREIGLSEPGRVTMSPALSPSGDLIAALATPGLELDVVILSARDGKLIRNLTKGFTSRYRYVVSQATEGQRDLGWSPDGDHLAFFVARENYRELHVHEVTSGKRVLRVKFQDIADCASPAFAPDGRSIAFSGNRDGAWDIFRYDLETKTVENLTQDEYYDGNPTWSADGKTILYNRRIGPFAKIFSVVVGSPERKVQLTGGAAADIMPTFSPDGQSVFFSSDRGLYGVFNIHRLDLGSGRIERLTDLVGGAFTPAPMAAAEDGSPQLAYVAFHALTFRLYRMKLGGAEVERAVRIGASEPQTSPRAPSRREAFRAANRARALAEPAEPQPEFAAPPVRGGTPQPPVTAPTGPGGEPSPPPPPPGSPETSAPAGSWPAGTLEEPSTEQPPGAKRPDDGGATARTGSGAGTAGPAGATGQTESGPVTDVPPRGAGPDEAEDKAEEEAPDADLRPFRPPVELGLDPERMEPYRRRWEIDVPSIAVGVTDNGQFLADFTINFSDLLGDQRLALRAYTVSSYSNLDFTYTNLAGRLDWGARLIDFRDYYLSGTTGARVEQEQRFSEISAFAHYPLSRYRRIEGAIGYGQRRTNYPFYVPETGGIQFLEYADDFPSVSLAYVADTVRNREFGPFHGHRFRLEGTYYYFVSGDSSGESVTSFQFDWRGYQHVTSRSLLAARVVAVRQTGNRAPVYSIGGINQLRGFEYREFLGTSIAFANLEYRFPLIDELDTGFIGSLGPFLGYAFVDAGTTWFEDTPHLYCNPNEAGILVCDPTPRVGRAAYDPKYGVLRQYDARQDDYLRDVYVSTGLGFTTPVAGLPLTWMFAKIWNGQDLEKWHSSFYIVYGW